MDKLDDVINKYNNSYHSTIKMNSKKQIKMSLELNK